MKFLWVFLLLLACNKKNQDIEDYRKDLMEINNNSRHWAKRIGLSATTEADIGGSVRDAGLFDGILCMSGEKESEKAILASQGPDGRFWRSPSHVGNVEEHSYSRDMTVGTLGCLMHIGAKEQAMRWGEYIESQGNRVCPRDQGSCDLNIASPLWSVFAYSWEKLGLPLSNAMKTHKHNETALVFTVPTTKGYATHLIGVEVLILQKAGVKKTHTALALQKKEPENPFYAYLTGNWNRAAELTVRYCPKTRPAVRRDWIFQRDAPYDPNRSSGWECIAMTNFLLRD